MEQGQEPHIEEISLYQAGSIPGIPGEHPAGIATVDWDARQVVAIRPFPAPDDGNAEDAPPAQPEQETATANGPNPAILFASPVISSNGG